MRNTSWAGKEVCLGKGKLWSPENKMWREVMTARLGKTRPLGKSLTHEAGPDLSLPYLTLHNHVPPTIISTW